MRISYFRVKKFQKVPTWGRQFFPRYRPLWAFKKSRILCWFQIWRSYSEKYTVKNNPEKLLFYLKKIFRSPENMVFGVKFCWYISSEYFLQIWNQQKKLDFFSTQIELFRKKIPLLEEDLLFLTRKYEIRKTKADKWK